MGPKNKAKTKTKHCLTPNQHEGHSCPFSILVSLSTEMYIKNCLVFTSLLHLSSSYFQQSFEKGQQIPHIRQIEGEGAHSCAGLPVGEKRR